MSGMFPKPTAIKIAEGNPGKKKLPKNEPKPKTKAKLEPPAYLSEEAKAIWNQLAPEYVAMDLLYSVDVTKFAMYCDSIATYERLTEEIEREGDVVMGSNKKGNTYVLPNPKCALKHQAFVRIQKLGAEMGDSPGSRARLGKLMDDDEDDALDRFLKEE